MGFSAVSIFGCVVSSIRDILLCVVDSLFSQGVMTAMDFLEDVGVNSLISLITSLGVSISVRFWALG